MPQPTKAEYTDFEEERRESGMAYILIGWLCWIFGFLVMFFNPAAIKIGKLNMVEIAVFLAVAGLALNVIGYRVRGRKRI